MLAKFYLGNVEATQQFGRFIGQIIEPHTVLALCGELGSGKTLLTQAIAKELGVKEFVVSPTFTTINEYHSGHLPLYHFDLYRFLDESTQAEFLFSSQLEEVLQMKAVVIIEWAKVLLDRFDIDLSSLCPEGYLNLDLEMAPDAEHARIITLKSIAKKDQLSNLLFSKLCESSEKFLSKPA